MNLDGQALHAAKFHDRKTVVRADFAQHAVNMIADGLFGELQLGCDLLIRHSPADKQDQLLFAVG